MTACKTASGVEIIPPHLVTRAGVNVPTHLNTRKKTYATYSTYNLAFYDCKEYLEFALLFYWKVTF